MEYVGICMWTMITFLTPKHTAFKFTPGYTNSHWESWKSKTGSACLGLLTDKTSSVQTSIDHNTHQAWTCLLVCSIPIRSRGGFKLLEHYQLWLECGAMERLLRPVCWNTPDERWASRRRRLTPYLLSLASTATIQATTFWYPCHTSQSPA